jgi:HK97 family phage prohead protease
VTARAPELKYASAFASVDTDGRFCGYASLFGRADLAGDIVMPGAFARTLRRKGAEGIGLLLEHDPKRPIGVWTLIEEDRRGLWVEGRLDDGREAIRAAEAMAAGELDGLSIGFRTIGADEDRRARVRRLIEIDLWEVSVVASPMLPEARARAAGAVRAKGAAAPQPSGQPPLTVSGQSPRFHAADAGLIARMRRTTAILREQR